MVSRLLAEFGRKKTTGLPDLLLRMVQSKGGELQEPYTIPIW